MKKCLLLTLTVLGFTSFSYAASWEAGTLSCNDGQPFGVVLEIGGQWGTVAFMSDHYDTAQHPAPPQNDHFGLECKAVPGAMKCTGVWAWENKPAKVIFTKDHSGNVSATFTRSEYYGGDLVTVPCVARSPISSN